MSLALADLSQGKLLNANVYKEYKESARTKLFNPSYIQNVQFLTTMIQEGYRCCFSFPSSRSCPIILKLLTPLKNSTK